MLDAVVPAQPAHPSQQIHPRSASPASSASAQSPPEEAGPRGTKSPKAVDDEAGTAIADSQENARDLEFMMEMFGDDVLHWGERNLQRKTTFPFQPSQQESFDVQMEEVKSATEVPHAAAAAPASPKATAKKSLKDLAAQRGRGVSLPSSLFVVR
jgi:hypothetical protein